MLFNFIDIFYFMTVTNVFGVSIWPSSGWLLWGKENSYNENMSESLHINSPSILQNRTTIWSAIHNMYWLSTSLQTISTSDIFIVTHILFYYSTVNFNQK